MNMAFVDANGGNETWILRGVDVGAPARAVF